MSKKQKAASDPAVIDAIFAEWIDHIPVYRRARTDVVAATAMMPWWAQPGPERITHDGSPCGTVVVWPAIRDTLPPPHPAGTRAIRPWRGQIEQWYKTYPAPAETRQKWLDVAIAKLEARLKDQAAEQDRAGLPKLFRVLQKAESRFHTLRNIALWMGPSPYRLAFDRLSELAQYADGDATIAQQTEATGSSDCYHWRCDLENVFGVLPPKMAEVTARVLKTSSGPFRRTPIYIGRDRMDPKHGFGLWRPADVPATAALSEAA